MEALRGDLIAFLQKLVQTPSLSGQEQQAQQLVAEKLRALGLSVDVVSSELDDLKHHPAFCDDGVPFRDRLNVIGRWKGSGKSAGTPRSLILNGHMDVVPTSNETLWSESPWSGAIRDGQLYGRGSCCALPLVRLRIAMRAAWTAGKALADVIHEGDGGFLGLDEAIEIAKRQEFRCAIGQDGWHALVIGGIANSRMAEE